MKTRRCNKCYNILDIECFSIVSVRNGYPSRRKTCMTCEGYNDNPFNKSNFQPIHRANQLSYKIKDLTEYIAYLKKCKPTQTIKELIQRNTERLQEHKKLNKKEKKKTTQNK